MGEQQGLLATAGDTYPLTTNTEYVTQAWSWSQKLAVTISTHSGQGHIRARENSPLPSWRGPFWAHCSNNLHHHLSFLRQSPARQDFKIDTAQR